VAALSPALGLAYFHADLPILTGDKIEQRCRILSLLLTAAVRSGEISSREVGERVTSPESTSPDGAI
jgi:hypothetical protein